jgi:hypothetical protein
MDINKLSKLYEELESDALIYTPYSYSVKQTNQIIRKHFKTLADDIDNLKEQSFDDGFKAGYDEAISQMRFKLDDMGKE